ncbi:MBL fold metallo-hydrolase [Alicyclobacillus dauci]|uniref:MBL fold metallo-hydrolase n=1 Tax=Alicyclobacillus dauci TaxID=1475485 RepID=A0ABY6YZK3_9BACL|nr:MBL fold metallo-hydrolase [Alicyclobacillus dauci]WAH35743.1 MBL fold metallo-hydrolase [Alicyclobacillus dauci]
MPSTLYPTPVKMNDDVWQIDLLEQNIPYRTGAYVIVDERPTLVETGAANSHEVLIAGLDTIGLSPKDLAYVIVTHVHLDHAGGAGQMMSAAPQAKLVVHPRGARHMADPSKLWAGAQAVYGDRTEDLFGAVQPVPEENILIRDHESTLNIGKRTLTFFDSPGHAKHHFTILDPVSNALYAGDAAGILYPTEFTGYGYDFIMPTTSPVDFDPAAVHNTMDMLRKLPFEWVYHTHFGKSAKDEAIKHTERLADAFATLIADVYQEGVELQTVIAALRQLVENDLRAQGRTPEKIEALDIDIVLDSMGLLYYEEKPERTCRSKISALLHAVGRMYACALSKCVHPACFYFDDLDCASVDNGEDAVSPMDGWDMGVRSVPRRSNDEGMEYSFGDAPLRFCLAAVGAPPKHQQCFSRCPVCFTSLDKPTACPFSPRPSL